MERTRAIAALLGPVLLVTGVMLLVDLARFGVIVADLARSPMLLMLAGYVTFVPGVAVVYWHNRWRGGVLPVVVTGLGWLFVAAGVVRIVGAYALGDVVGGLAGSVAPWVAEVGLVMIGGGGWLSWEGWRR